MARHERQSHPARISQQDLAQDRAFWRDLLARRSGSRGLPAHSAGGYWNRRFAIIRDAVWITLYRATLPFPQVGVFLRCVGLAGDAFFTLADSTRTEIEPRLRAEIGLEATMEWGTSHHPGMTDIAANLGAPLPWDDRAARRQIRWMLRSVLYGGIASTPWLAVPGEAGTCERSQVDKEAASGQSLE